MVLTAILYSLRDYEHVSQAVQDNAYQQHRVGSVQEFCAFVNGVRASEQLGDNGTVLGCAIYSGFHTPEPELIADDRSERFVTPERLVFSYVLVDAITAFASAAVDAREARASGASSESLDQHDALVVSAMDNIERLVEEHYKCK